MSNKKLSYRSNRGERRERLKNLTLAPSEKDSHTHPYGAAGIIPLDIREITTDDAPAPEGDADVKEDFGDKNLSTIDNKTVKELNELFIATADAMDKFGDHNSASFLDFLIKKFSESKNLDYSVKFNDLLFKINESDLVDLNKILIYFVKQYSRNINRDVISGEDLRVAKENAYNKSVKLFEDVIGG